jgi:hypothetical protein
MGDSISLPIMRVRGKWWRRGRDSNPKRSRSERVLWLLALSKTKARGGISGGFDIPPDYARSWQMVAEREGFEPKALA